MSLSRKRYWWLRAILILFIVWAIYIGSWRIISYDFGDPIQNTWTQENKNTDLDSDKQIPERGGHPREALFEEEANTTDKQWVDSDATKEEVWDKQIDFSAFDTPDWSAKTHSNTVAPDTDEVFADDKVKRLDLVIDPDEWAAMLENMTELYGEAWEQTLWWGEQRQWPPVGELEDQAGAVWQEQAPQWVPLRWERPPRHEGEWFAGGRGGGFGWPWGAGWGTFSDEDPMYTAAEIFYDDTQWYKVWVRFKGNSSLKSTWSSGNMKLSFKLNFDYYEDEYPWIKNQRFYGYDKLSLKNNYSDTSMIREKVASDVFSDAGLVVSHTALYEVYVDYGEGSEYFGVYTLVEEVDDTVIETQYAEADGNLYKPDGQAATFAVGSYNEDQYVKKSNESEEDYSDVEKLLEVINDDKRLTNSVIWREDLDAIFDTDVFLKYLAINTTIQNWDTYGAMTHNYFMYNNPETGKLTWIPWDNNESLQTWKRGGITLDFSSLSGGEWPLIEYIYADEVYKEIYDKYLQQTIDDWFAVDKMQEVYDTYADLVQPYALAEQEGFTFLRNADAFATEITYLKEHVVTRKDAVEIYLQQ